ncbi:MAG: lipase family protein [Clostridia bacterium]|nr:lipase family protein [Clostridia bacterium]
MSLLFRACLSKAYVHVREGGDYAIERRGDALYVYLEGSDGGEDWKNNLDFPVRVATRPGEISLRIHRGFLRVWNAMEPYLKPDLLDRSVQRIVISGYSHGAALAALCHEYVWRSRPDLRERMEGYGFGAPRVLWGARPPQLLARWERFTVVRNLDDLVTHLPPAWLGYYHVGKLLEIGEKGRYSDVDAHRAENLLAELLAYEKGLNLSAPKSM